MNYWSYWASEHRSPSRSQRHFGIGIPPPSTSSELYISAFHIHTRVVRFWTKIRALADSLSLQLEGKAKKNEVYSIMARGVQGSSSSSLGSEPRAGSHRFVSSAEKKKERERKKIVRNYIWRNSVIVLHTASVTTTTVIQYFHVISAN